MQRPEDGVGTGAGASDAGLTTPSHSPGTPPSHSPGAAPLHPARSARAPHSRYPGLVSRLLALGLDAVLVGALVALVGAGGPALWHTLTGNTPDWLRVCASVAAGAVPVVYFWLSWWAIGRSFGGLLLGFVVLRADGHRMRLLHAAARAFLGLLFAPLWLVGMLLILVTPRRRALHDILLGTVVTRTTHDPLDHAPHPNPPHPAAAPAPPPA